VLGAVAHRGVAEAATQLLPNSLDLLANTKNTNKRKDARKELSDAAMKKARALLKSQGIEIGEHDTELRGYIEDAVESIPPGEFHARGRFEVSRTESARGEFSEIRTTTGGGKLELRDLRPDERTVVEERWKPYDWIAATKPFKCADDLLEWRCSESVVRHSRGGEQAERNSGDDQRIRSASDRPDVVHKLESLPCAPRAPALLWQAIESGARVKIRNSKSGRVTLAEKIELRLGIAGEVLVRGRVVGDDGSLSEHKVDLGSLARIELV
jgi:hypothetical protein